MAEHFVDQVHTRNEGNKSNLLNRHMIADHFCLLTIAFVFFIFWFKLLSLVSTCECRFCIFTHLFISMHLPFMYRIVYMKAGPQ